MIDKRYTVLFSTGNSITSVDVYAGCQDEAQILAQAVMIKDGKNWRKLISITEQS